MNREFIVVHGVFDGEPIVIFTDTITAVKKCVNEEADGTKYESTEIHTGLSGCFFVKETMVEVCNKIFRDDSIPHSKRSVTFDQCCRILDDDHRSDAFEKFMEEVSVHVFGENIFKKGDKNNG